MLTAVPALVEIDGGAFAIVSGGVGGQRGDIWERSERDVRAGAVIADSVGGRAIAGGRVEVSRAGLSIGNHSAAVWIREGLGVPGK